MDMTETPETRPLTARELILTLMDSAAADTLDASYFIAAGALFGMDSGSIRVALARLVRNGSLLAVSRGRYGPGTRRGALHTLVRNWSRAETHLRPWTGNWLTVITAHLARADKTRLRGNERALKLLGFVRVEAGFWLRPANLNRDLEEVRDDLTGLGLDPTCICAVVDRFTPDPASHPDQLWQTRALNERYQENIALLHESRARLADLDEPSAARETLLIGRRVTRDILLDPMLPDELVDGRARRRMIDAMRHYDRLGKALWRAFYTAHQAGNHAGPRPSASQKPAA